MGKEFWGCIIVLWAVSNGLMWIICWDEDLKIKLILPQAATIFFIIFGIGCYLMRG